MERLGTLGGTRSEAFAINDLGQVAGQSRNADGVQRIFVWHDGTMADLGPSFGFGRRRGINNRGQIAREGGEFYDPAFGRLKLEDLMLPGAAKGEGHC